MWSTQRPRDRMYDFAIDRITVLTDFAKRHCREPTCGARDEDGALVSCRSDQCGEKRLEEWLRRELQVMRDLRELVEWLERDELAKLAAEDKKGKRK